MRYFSFYMNNKSSIASTPCLEFKSLFLVLFYREDSASQRLSQGKSIFWVGYSKFKNTTTD